MAPEAEEYIRQIEAVQRDAHDIAAGLTDAQFNWRPAPGRWSIAQCLDHLSVTASHYLAVIDQGIERARARGLYGSGPFRHGWLGRWFARSLEPPVKRKVKAPKAFQPGPEMLREKALSEFLAVHDAVIERIRRAGGLDLGRARVSSGILPLVKFSLGQTFAIVAAHARRHLWQARQVRAAAGFPAA